MNNSHVIYFRRLKASFASLCPVLDIPDPDIQYFRTTTNYQPEGDVESFPDITHKRIVQLADMLQDEGPSRGEEPPN
jgi:hypothetical protein